MCSCTASYEFHGLLVMSFLSHLFVDIAGRLPVMLPKKALLTVCQQFLFRHDHIATHVYTFFLDADCVKTGQMNKFIHAEFGSLLLGCLSVWVGLA